MLGVQGLGVRGGGGGDVLPKKLGERPSSAVSGTYVGVASLPSAASCLAACASESNVRRGAPVTPSSVVGASLLTSRPLMLLPLPSRSSFANASIATLYLRCNKHFSSRRLAVATSQPPAVAASRHPTWLLLWRQSGWPPPRCSRRGYLSPQERAPTASPGCRVRGQGCGLESSRATMLWKANVKPASPVEYVLDMEKRGSLDMPD